MTHRELIERLREAERLLGEIISTVHVVGVTTVSETTVSKELIELAHDHQSGRTELKVPIIWSRGVAKRAEEIDAYLARYKDHPLPEAVEVEASTFVKRKAMSMLDLLGKPIQDVVSEVAKINATEQPVFTPQPQDESSGVNAFFNTWVGDETDEEIQEAAKDLRKGESVPLDELAKAQGIEPIRADMSNLPAMPAEHDPEAHLAWIKARKMTADELLAKVHKRLGGLGVDIRTFGESTVIEALWKRSYNGILSDERQTSANSLMCVFLRILDYEDEADRADAEEGE